MRTEQEKSWIAAVCENKRAIQEALRAAGYFAYTVKLTVLPSPVVEITARLWEEGDERLLADQALTTPNSAPQAAQ
jgi:hypothetical protein